MAKRIDVSLVCITLAIILVACLIAGIATERWGESQASIAAATFRPGEAVPAIDGVKFGGADRTLLLFVRSDCYYCTQSMPLFKRLVERRDRSKARVQIAMVSMEAQGLLEAYVRASGVTPDAVRSVSRTDWAKVYALPTVMVVERTGRLAAA